MVDIIQKIQNSIRKQTRFYLPSAGWAKPIEFVKERGLDEFCNENKKYKHQWLLLPKLKDQKQYIICLFCLQSSHL